MRVKQPEAARPIPIDEKLAQIEADRRSALKENVTYQAGRAAGLHTFASNTLLEFNAKLVVVRKAAITRDVNASRRQHYDRKHRELVAVAERLHECTGEAVSYPMWIPPPDAVQEVMVVIPAQRTDWLAK